MPKKIKAILLDLDNTLYPYDKCNNAAIDASVAKLAETLGKTKDEVRKAFDKARENVKSELKDTAASHSRSLYFQKTIESLKGKTDFLLTQQIHDFFWKIYFDNMELCEGVLEFFKYAKKQNMPIAIVTDLTTEIQMKKIRHLGIDRHIDFLVSSEEAGKDKPNPQIFTLALKKLGITKDEAVMIGDDAKDVNGAKKAGIACIQVKGCDFNTAFESFKTLISK